MQLRLIFPFNLTPNKEHYKRIEESKTNKYIAFLLNRNRGLKGENTKLKKK